MPKKVAIGVVTGDKMDKTRRVEIHRKVPHPVYGKYIRKRTVCFVHDEENESNAGDTVEIIEAAPRSKQKRWDLVRVVTRTTEVDLAAMRLAATADEEEEAQPVAEEAATEEVVVEEAAAEEVTEEAVEESTEEAAGDDESSTEEAVAEAVETEEQESGEEEAGDSDSEESTEE